MLMFAISGVLLVVVCGELVLVLVGFQALVRGPASTVRELVDRQAQDIRDRAKVGLTPEWHQYEQGLTERLSDREDSLRIYSAMALTGGVLGTMLTMALVLLTSGGSGSTLLFEAILRHVGWALVASAVGVLAHLLLATFSRFAHGRASRARKDCLAELGDVSRSHVPNTVVESQLEAVTAAMQKSLIDAVRTSLETLPAVVERLDERVVALGALMGTTGAAVQEMATAVGSATQRIEGAANQLGTLSERMVEVGGTLAAVPGQMKEEVDRLAATVATVNEGLASLPNKFDEELRKTIGQWQEESRSQSAAIATSYKDAAAIVSQSVSVLKAEVDRLKDSWQTTAGNELRNVMQEAGAGFATVIKDDVREPLVRVGNEFATAQTHAEQIRTSLADTSTSLTAWQSAMGDLLRDAATLAERMRSGADDERTLTALSELRRAIDKLESRLGAMPAGERNAVTQLDQLNQKMELLVGYTRPWPSRVVGGLMGWYRNPDSAR